MKKKLWMLGAVLALFALFSGQAFAGQWEQREDHWRYHSDGGVYVENNWLEDQGRWYYFDSDTFMTTGWKQIRDSWYYFGEDGIMQTGWRPVENAWYYFGTDGAMRTGWRQSGEAWYYLGEDGAMATGWKQIGDTWYYFEHSGTMRTADLPVDGIIYHFDANGACLNPYGSDTAAAKLRYAQELLAVLERMKETTGKMETTENDGSDAAFQIMEEVKQEFSDYANLNAPEEYAAANEKIREGSLKIVEAVNLAIEIARMEPSEESGPGDQAELAAKVERGERLMGEGEELFLAGLDMLIEQGIQLSAEDLDFLREQA